MLRDALGDLYEQVEFVSANDDPGHASQIPSPLWDSLRRGSQPPLSGAQTLPYLTAVATAA